MSGLVDYFPVHIWVVVLALMGVAVLGFFIPPAIGISAGLTLEQYILLVGAIELGAALGIAGIVIYYRDPDRESSEWRYDP